MLKPINWSSLSLNCSLTFFLSLVFLSCFLGEILSIIFNSFIFSLTISSLELISSVEFLFWWRYFSLPRFLVVLFSIHPFWFHLCWHFPHNVLLFFFFRVISSHIFLSILNIFKSSLRWFHNISFNSNKLCTFVLLAIFLSIGFWLKSSFWDEACIPSVSLSLLASTPSVLSPSCLVVLWLPSFCIWLCGPQFRPRSTNRASDIQPTVTEDSTDPGTKPGNGLLPFLVTRLYLCPLFPLSPQFAKSCSPRQE